MLKYTPKDFLIYGIIIYSILLIAGPYTYHFKSIQSIIYLAIAYFLLFCGIYTSKIKVKKRQVKKSFDIDELVGNSEKILIAIEMISVICFIIYTLTLKKNIGVNAVLMSGDFRNAASQGTMISKIANVGVNASIGIFIIVEFTKKINSKLLLRISKYLFWLPALTNLLVGARWSLFISIILYFVIVNYSKKLFPERKQKKPQFAVLLLIFFFLNISANLFASRGLSASVVHYMPYYGEIEVKNFYANIHFPSKGFEKGFYSFWYYFTHSVPYYSTIFDKVDFGIKYYGAYMGRILGFISNNLPSYKDIVNSQPVLNGTYSTFITGYFYDFGYLGSLVMTFLTGNVFGKIYHNRYKKRLCLYMFPVILVMCVISPIYYFFHVAGMDFVVVTLLMEYFLIKKISNFQIIRKAG